MALLKQSSNRNSFRLVVTVNVGAMLYKVIQLQDRKQEESLIQHIYKHNVYIYSMTFGLFWGAFIHQNISMCYLVSYTPAMA